MFRNRLPILPLALVAMSSVSGCAGHTPTYDQHAKESLGRIVAKDITGTHRQPRADSPGSASSDEAFRAYAISRYGAVGGLVSGLVASSLRTDSNLPIYEYNIKLADGRLVAVSTTYSRNDIGECVKVFESTQPGYPRFISYDGCSPSQ